MRGEVDADVLPREDLGNGLLSVLGQERLAEEGRKSPAHSLGETKTTLERTRAGGATGCVPRCSTSRSRRTTKEDDDPDSVPHLCAKIPRSVHKEELHSPVPRFLIVSSICASEALLVSVPKIDRQISSGCKTFTVFLGRFAFSFSEQNSFDYLSYKFQNAIASSVVPGSSWRITKKVSSNEKKPVSVQ